jgi:hypothetical protein
MGEPPDTKDDQDQPLLEWVTPELIVEKVNTVTQGGGLIPPAGDPETGTGPDPEFYAS